MVSDIISTANDATDGDVQGPTQPTQPTHTVQRKRSFLDNVPLHSDYGIAMVILYAWDCSRKFACKS